jgi:hypothetical protein
VITFVSSSFGLGSGVPAEDDPGGLPSVDSLSESQRPISYVGIIELEELTWTGNSLLLLNRDIVHHLPRLLCSIVGRNSS